jgi:hypothetical protein
MGQPCALTARKHWGSFEVVGNVSKEALAIGAMASHGSRRVAVVLPRILGDASPAIAGRPTVGDLAARSIIVDLQAYCAKLSTCAELALASYAEELHRRMRKEDRLMQVRLVRLSWQRVPISRGIRRSRAMRRTSGNSSPPADEGDEPEPYPIEPHEPFLAAFRVSPPNQSSSFFFKVLVRLRCVPLAQRGAACISFER